MPGSGGPRAEPSQSPSAGAANAAWPVSVARIASGGTGIASLRRTDCRAGIPRGRPDQHRAESAQGRLVRTAGTVGIAAGQAAFDVRDRAEWVVLAGDV